MKHQIKAETQIRMKVYIFNKCKSLAFGRLLLFEITTQWLFIPVTDRPNLPRPRFKLSTNVSATLRVVVYLFLVWKLKSEAKRRDADSEPVEIPFSRRNVFSLHFQPTSRVQSEGRPAEASRLSSEIILFVSCIQSSRLYNYGTVLEWPRLTARHSAKWKKKKKIGKGKSRG